MAKVDELDPGVQGWLGNQFTSLDVPALECLGAHDCNLMPASANHPPFDDAVGREIFRNPSLIPSYNVGVRARATGQQ